jgi:hypothetical protein
MTSTTQFEQVEPTARTARPSRWVRAFLTLLLVPALCLAWYFYRTSHSPGPWEQIIRKSGETAQSPFGREVFADGSISSDEYARANRRIVECARQKGVTFNLENRYGLVIFSSAGSNEAATLDRCESGDLAVVRSLYEAQYKDPRREGDVVYYRCLEGAGFPISAASPPRTASIDDVLDRFLDSSAPGDFSKVERCIYDPAGFSTK